MKKTLIPPMPPMPSNRISGLEVIGALRRNAYSAFPPRCLTEPVVRLDIGWKYLVLVTAPDAIGRIMITHAEEYGRLPFGRRILEPIIGRGLLVSEGETWREQRRAMAPAFTPRNVPVMVRHIVSCTENVYGRLKGSCGTAIDLQQEFKDLSLNIAANTLFSMEAATFGSELHQLMGEYGDTIGQIFPTDVLLPDWFPTLLRVRRASFRRRWMRLIDSIIETRRKMPPPKVPRDLFDLLSEAHGPDRNGLLADEASTMLVAGYLTTALTLFWACTLLAGSPRWQDALADEVSNLDLSIENAAASLPKLVCTRAVVEETLRLYPPASITGRVAKRSDEICGVRVPAGSFVLIPYWLLHRSPQWWSSPEEFDPTRFLQPSEIKRLTYLPFGVGKHVCIGAQLALSESILAIAQLVQTFVISKVSDRPVLPVGKLSTYPDHSPRFLLHLRKAHLPAGSVVTPLFSRSAQK